MRLRHLLSLLLLVPAAPAGGSKRCWPAFQHLGPAFPVNATLPTNARLGLYPGHRPRAKLLDARGAEVGSRFVAAQAPGEPDWVVPEAPLQAGQTYTLVTSFGEKTDFQAGPGPDRVAPRLSRISLTGAPDTTTNACGEYSGVKVDSTDASDDQTPPARLLLRISVPEQGWTFFARPGEGLAVYGTTPHVRANVDYPAEVVALDEAFNTSAPIQVTLRFAEVGRGGRLRLAPLAPGPAAGHP